MRFVIATLALAAAASAQVGPPLLGWLPAGTEIRPIHGLPGAATLGRPATIGHQLAHIAVSPSQNYVLATDATTGKALMIAGGSAATLNTTALPDQIVVSPRGSSALLWFAASGHFEILTGLPSVPSIRRIDASWLNLPPAAIAVSDDGQSIASASSAGVFEWGADGAPQQVYAGSDAAALAFYARSPNLALATSNKLLSIEGTVTSVLYQASFSPAGLAATFDNQEIVLADRNGTIYSINAATHTPSIVNCQCRPTGVFGLGGSLFRLTSSSVDAVKLFDASTTGILAVPGDGLKITRHVAARPQAAAALPTLTIHLTSAPTGYLQQPAVTITASSASTAEIDGNVTLSFVSGSNTASIIGSTDGSIQFSTGGTTANFVIPAGATQASFSGASSATFSTGTTAGTISVTANVTAPSSVAAVATQTVTLKQAVPTITSVTLSQTSGGVTVVVTGYSPTDDMISGTFDFALSTGASLTVNDLTVSLSSVFQTWYTSTSSYPTGSEFTLTVPFAIVGNPNDLTGVTVTLINAVAASSPVSSK